MTTDLWERSKFVSTLSNTEFRCQLSQLVRDFIEKLKSQSSKKRLVNSLQLPKEVKQFCIDNNIPTEVLNFAVELQKSSEGNKEGQISDIAKKLLDLWIESNSCAETFLRFSLHRGYSSETENFNRILFSIADTFHLHRREFPRFIFDQILLVTLALTESIQRGEEQEIRTAYLSSVIDRVFLRFHSESENFYSHFDNEDELAVEITDPFLLFLISTIKQCQENFVARRLWGRILLGLGQNTINKISKAIFLTDAYTQIDTSVSPASKLLFPPEEFIHNNPTWKHALFTSLPLKTRLENLSYFTSWANFVWSETVELMSTGHRDIDNVWKICCDSWSVIIHNSCADQKTMLSSTHALVALLKCIKKSAATDSKYKDQVEHLFGSISSEISNILRCISKCLDSTDSNKQACGMAVGQIVCELMEVHRKKLDKSTEARPSSSDEGVPHDTTGEKNARTDGNTRLKFDSTDPLFLKFVNFFEDKTAGKLTKAATRNLKITPRNFYGKFKFLDSDDEEEESVDDNQKENHLREKITVEGSNSDDEPCPFEPYDMSNDTPLDESLYNLKGLGKKMPIYFSDICEVLFEAHGSKDEAIMERLKQIAVLRIPLLLFNKIKIDSSTAQKLARMLAEIDNGGILEIPIIFGLYELSIVHPVEVFQSLAQVSFDKDRAAMGHRMNVLSRYSEIVHLLSKQKCFSCFSEDTGKLDRLLAEIHQPFIKDYVEKRRLTRKCQLCFKAEKNVAVAETTPVSKHLISGTPTSSSLVSEKDLTWRQIVDERVASKTRRFASSKEGKFIETPDIYSATLVPIIWSSLANRLMTNTILLKDSQAVNNVTMAVFTAHALRILGWTVFGTSGIYCPHLRNIATQAADLVKMFYNHTDPHVRRSVISLLSIITTSAEGKSFVMEIFTSQENLFDQIRPVFQHDPDPDNRFLFNNLMKFVAAAAAVEMGNFLN